MKKTLKVVSVVLAIFVIVGIANYFTHQEAHRLGFSTRAEMNSIHAQGWHTKSRYEEDMALKGGYKSVAEWKAAEEKMVAEAAKVAEITRAAEAKLTAETKAAEAAKVAEEKIASEAKLAQENSERVSKTNDAESKPKAIKLTYTDFILTPEKYLYKKVIMEGDFVDHRTEKRSFFMEEGGHRVEVFYSALPKEKQADILTKKRKPFFKDHATVTGTLRTYSNAGDSYMISADDVTW
jgi:hypothetical protein